MDKLLCVEQSPGKLSMHFDTTLGGRVPEGFALDFDAGQWAGFSAEVAPDIPVEASDLTLWVQDGDKNDGGYIPRTTSMRVTFNGDVEGLNFRTRHEGVHYLEDKQGADMHTALTRFSNRGERMLPYTAVPAILGLACNVLTLPDPPTSIKLGTAALLAYHVAVFGTYLYNPAEKRANDVAKLHKQFSPFVLKPLSEYDAN